MALQPAPVSRVNSRGAPTQFKGLDAASATSVGQEWNLLEPFGLFSVQVDAACTIQLQGSLNGTDWVTLDTLTFTGADIQSVAVQAVVYTRLRITSGSSVTAWMAVGEASAIASGGGLIVTIDAGVTVDPNNTTTTPLTAGATFTGTATDISDYQQLNIEIYGRPSEIQGDGSTAKASFFFEFSPDGTNWDISVPALIRDPGLVIPTPVINVGRYFRVRYVNDGGSSAISILGLGESAGTPTAQTTFRLTTQLLPLATKELTRTLDQGISGSDPVSIVRAALMGRDPTDTIANVGLTRSHALRVADDRQSIDTFGDLAVSSRIEEIAIAYDDTNALTNLTDVVTSGGGTATISSSQLRMASSTAGTATVRVTSREKVRYRPGHEVAGLFTAAWPVAGIASSVSRIGLFDDDDGFWIGYSGTSFGTGVRRGGTDTFTARASWTTDLLTGVSTSLFQRGSSPEAIDLTKVNIFRVRFGWLGSAPAVWEVLSPDGQWVEFHRERTPNLSVDVHILDPNLPIRAEIVKTGAAATDLTMRSGSWSGSVRGLALEARTSRANCSITPLSGGATFTGAFENIEQFAGATVAITTDVSGSLLIDNSEDGSTTDRTSTFTVTGGTPFFIGLTPLMRYIRVRYTNGGSAQATFRLQTIFKIGALNPTTQRADVALSDASILQQVKAVIAGKNPDGSYVNFPASGPVTSNSTTTNLAGGAAFTGTFVDTSGYATASLLLNASHDSATSGVSFQWSTDGSNIDRTVAYDYVAANGGAFFVLPIEAQYLRVVYTNGATLTTSLRLELTLHDDPLPAVQAPLSARVTRSQVAAMVKNDPIPLVTGKTSQETVGTTSAQLACSSSPLSLRKSLSFKSDANNTNNNIIYISFQSPATTGNGYGLSNGDSIDIEVGDRDDSGAVVGIYAIATNAGQKLHVMEIS